MQVSFFHFLNKWLIMFWKAQTNCEVLITCHLIVNLFNQFSFMKFSFRSWKSIDVDHWWIRCWQNRKYKEGHSIFCFGCSCWHQKGWRWQSNIFKKGTYYFLLSTYIFFLIKLENNDPWRSNYFSQWVLTLLSLNEFISTCLLYLIRSGIRGIWKCKNNSKQ